MNDAVKCFWLEPTGRQRIGLRRYRTSEASPCPRPYGYHNAIRWIGEEVATRTQGGINPLEQKQYLDDPRWPAACECGAEFDPLDEFQVFTAVLYRRTDALGGEMILSEAPPGAMWDAPWRQPGRTGPDGRSLYVKCPDGTEWCIDGRAANCDSPCAECGRPYHEHDGARRARCEKGFRDSAPHQCWVRHGAVPVVTVDKCGVTCRAGAGSIITGKGHWFLRNGIFVTA